jgi:hypothetical protein
LYSLLPRNGWDFLDARYFPDELVSIIDSRQNGAQSVKPRKNGTQGTILDELGRLEKEGNANDSGDDNPEEATEEPNDDYDVDDDEGDYDAEKYFDDGDNEGELVDEYGGGRDREGTCPCILINSLKICHLPFNVISCSTLEPDF